MTPRQSQCLAFVTAYIAEHGFAPSFTDIMHGLSLKSKSGIWRLLNALEHQGYIKRVKSKEKTKSRGIKMTPDNNEAEIERLRRAIQDYLDGNYGPRQGKCNECPHGKFGWEECVNCIDEYFAGVINPPAEGKSL